MFFKLWNFLRGYVIIQVSGFSVERFINLAVYKGIYLWNINYCSNSVTMCVSIKGFRQLKSCAKKTKCRVRIIEKCGWPFILNKYKKRKVLFAGVLFFIFALYFLSSFIWIVEVDGNERVSSEKILEVASAFGVKPGAFKRLSDTAKLTQTLIMDFQDISWASVEVSGTLVRINIVETIVTPQIIDKDIPVDLVAKCDGVIVDIVTSAGTPKVKQMDVVREGDVLISGTVVVKDDETGLVTHNIHSYGIVRAKVVYKLVLSEPFVSTSKIYTGNVKKNRSFTVFDREFDFFRTGNPFANYDKITSEDFLDLGFGLILPIVIKTEDYSEFVLQQEKRSVSLLRELLSDKVDLKIVDSLGEEAEVIDKNLTFFDEKDKLSVTAVITTIERIDTERKIR